ncbi:hypothetical protein BBK36DRAFT_1162813 [Trichoderma citrinoviride]|uniref:SPT2-domain-containing protein n=1 Tax=Trichoderma citrinoviride TaxID=58853 RepID=A0A2T4AZQ5_9HYPO|nr:hypothetical protein BBK36DRAFT_1162813 [Trichoderma citrinoviride]PTB62555.1 hypothetical protein BBK36DRAFT_1162813 [Trichoderma citrinoviride]
MPIGDLLAQITGGQSSDSPAPAVQRQPSVSVKRKADDDISRADAKTPRLFTQPTKAPERPASTTLPKTTPNPSKPVTTPNPSKPVTIASRPAKPAVASKPPSAPLVDPNKPKAPPKKGSYAEILARAQRAQEVMGQVGKIQHKKVEKGAIKREKGTDAKGAPSDAQSRKPPVGYKGSARPVQRNGTNGNAPSKTANGAASRTPGKAMTSSRKAPAPEPEKKVKKAALATTGYTGTARPKPGNTSKKSNAPRGGALLNAPPPRPGANRRSRYEDDYDEDMDDFIDYDDEEDEGPRYGYASDGSSDMEAGLEDIDDEERMAERIARREDLREEQLERSLKMAKEEKKRKALEALRANRR